MIEDLEQRHLARLRQILAANADRTEQMRAASMHLEYEPDEDVLYVDFGGPSTAAITESVQNRLYLRVDPETLRLQGLEIHHFSRWLAEALGFAV